MACPSQSTGWSRSSSRICVWLISPPRGRPHKCTLQVGLGIGRLVFRALNSTELLIAVGIAVALGLSSPRIGIVVIFAIAFGALILQLAAVRPRLTRRSDAVLAGENAPRSRAHYVCVAFEVVKLVALTVGGILLLSS